MKESKRILELTGLLTEADKEFQMFLKDYEKLVSNVMEKAGVSGIKKLRAKYGDQMNTFEEEHWDELNNFYADQGERLANVLNSE